MRAGTRVPVDVPPHPRLVDVGLTQPRRLPRLPIIQTHVDLEDAAFAGPGAAAEQACAGTDLAVPRQLECALDLLRREHRTERRRLRSVVGTDENVARGVVVGV